MDLPAARLMPLQPVMVQVPASLPAPTVPARIPLMVMPLGTSFQLRPENAVAALLLKVTL